MATTEEAPLPRGVGRVPRWWMEITPHKTLNLEDELTRKHREEEEAKILARAAALEDLKQKYGGEGFPDWNPCTDGPRTDEEKEEFINLGWKRLPSGQWADEYGKKIDGRQFKGKIPAGYRPGENGGLGSGGGYYDPANFGPGGRGGLTSAAYARDSGNGWDQPEWLQKKLKSTGTGVGDAIRQGNYGVERGGTINKGDGTVATLKKADPQVAPAPPSNEPPWVKARREKEEAAAKEAAEKEAAAAAAAAATAEEEYVEEVVDEEVVEEEIVEEYVEEEIIEEIIEE